MTAQTSPPVRSGTGAPADLFFEDLSPGRTVDLGVITVDAGEMVAFARRFDPQWYHVDAELAAGATTAGLIASGFYTVSLFMRAYVDHLLSRAAADASPGLEELRWLAPVRAGDRLAVRVDVMGRPTRPPAPGSAPSASPAPWCASARTTGPSRRCCGPASVAGSYCANQPVPRPVVVTTPGSDTRCRRSVRAGRRY